MSEQGCLFHVALPRTRARTALKAFGGQLAVLGASRTVTSFIPLGGLPRDLAKAAANVGADLLAVWFDEDSALAIQLRGTDGRSAEWSLPMTDDDDAPAHDEAFVADLVSRKLARSDPRRILARRLSGPDAQEFVRTHGVETALGLPVIAAIRFGASADELKARFPKLEVIDGRPLDELPKPPPREPRAKPQTPRFNAVQQAAYEAHLSYWLNEFDGNDFRLPERYKRRMPANRRREVEDLMGAFFTGHEEEIPARLAAVLSAVFESKDWEKIFPLEAR